MVKLCLFFGIGNAYLTLERGNKDGKDKKRIKTWLNGRVDQSHGFSGICKIDQLKGGWDDSLDLHHYWSHYRPASIDPGSDSLLQLHRYHYDHGLQEREEG